MISLVFSVFFSFEFGRRRSARASLLMSFSFQRNLLNGVASKDDVGYACMIGACHEGLQWQLALHGVFSMSQPDLISVNRTLGSLDCEQWQLAIVLLAAMPTLQPSLIPNIVSYNAAIKCCSQHWQHALQLFHDVKIAQLQLTAMTFDAAWRACDPTEAWQFKQLLMGEFKHESGWSRDTGDH